MNSKDRRGDTEGREWTLQLHILLDRNRGWRDQLSQLNDSAPFGRFQEKVDIFKETNNQKTTQFVVFVNLPTVYFAHLSKIDTSTCLGFFTVVMLWNSLFSVWRSFFRSSNIEIMKGMVMSSQNRFPLSINDSNYTRRNRTLWPSSVTWFLTVRFFDRTNSRKRWRSLHLLSLWGKVHKTVVDKSLTPWFFRTFHSELRWGGYFGDQNCVSFNIVFNNGCLFYK